LLSTAGYHESSDGGRIQMLKIQTDAVVGHSVFQEGADSVDVAADRFVCQAALISNVAPIRFQRLLDWSAGRERGRRWRNLQLPQVTEQRLQPVGGQTARVAGGPSRVEESFHFGFAEIARSEARVCKPAAHVGQQLQVLASRICVVTLPQELADEASSKRPEWTRDPNI
jgi:hypothetical protein